MEKITRGEQLRAAYEQLYWDKIKAAMASVGVPYGELNDDNFWMVREQCRINDGTYTPIHIDGDDKMRFLHVSIDDPAKVSYTKDADKGRQDLQTRTTLAAYCEKFGLDMPLSFKDYLGVDDSMSMANHASVAQSLADKVDEDMVAMWNKSGAQQQRPVTIREKLGMIQDLLDEVIADIG